MDTPSIISTLDVLPTHNSLPIIQGSPKDYNMEATLGSAIPTLSLIRCNKIWCEKG
jgi:hypothetical protein